MHIDVLLTSHEYELLILMGGYSAGAASRMGDQRLKWKFVHICNRLFKDMPGFQQYEIPEEYAWRED